MRLSSFKPSASTATERSSTGKPASWPPFADTVEALRYLQQHFQLVILSNVDRESFSATQRRLGIEFDAVCTAQDIGSYKPDARNFACHDHAPANRAGIASAWIHRRHGKEGHGATRAPREMPQFSARFTTLGELAEAHRAELRA